MSSTPPVMDPPLRRSSARKWTGIVSCIQHVSRRIDGRQTGGPDWADDLADDGRQRLARHGHMPEREVMTGIGPVAVRCPRCRRSGWPRSRRMRLLPATRHRDLARQVRKGGRVPDQGSGCAARLLRLPGRALEVPANDQHHRKLVRNHPPLKGSLWQRASARASRCWIGALASRRRWFGCCAEQIGDSSVHTIQLAFV
jgi:hypothetical protein